MNIENRDVAIDTYLNIFEGGIYLTENMVLKITLTIFEYQRDELTLTYDRDNGFM